MTILESVAQVYGIDPETIKRKSRKRKSVDPRMICIAIYRATGKLKSFRQSNEFELSHDAIANAVKKTAWFLKYDKSFRAKVVESLKLINESKEQREKIIERMMNFHKRGCAACC